MGNYSSLDQLCAGVANATKVYETATKPDADHTVRRLLTVPFDWNGIKAGLRTFLISANWWAWNGMQYDRVEVEIGEPGYTPYLSEIYEETGNVGKYQYIRHRVCVKNREFTEDAGAFDIVQVSNNCIYVNIVNDPYIAQTWQSSRRTYFYFNGNNVATFNYTSDDEFPVKMRIVPNDAGMLATMRIYPGFDDLSDKLYLIYNPDNDKVYTYDGSDYVEITEPLSAAVFMQYGLTVLPDHFPDVFKVYAYSPTNPSVPSISICGDRILPSAYSAVTCHVTESSPYGFTAAHTDGDVYYSQDGTTWESEDSIADHTDYYIKVDNFNSLHSLSVITEDTSA